MSANIAEMAFVGETPWHGLGRELTDGASIDTWLAEANLGWSAVGVTPQYVDQTGAKRDMHGKKIIYRDDTGDALSVVSSGYQIVQPREVLEFFRGATEYGNWHIETAGSLDGGRKIWALARPDDNGALVRDGDRVRSYILMSTSLDGSIRTSATATAVRVVCQNTLSLAFDKAATGERVSVSHRSVYDPTAIYRAMEGASGKFSAFLEASRTLADKGMTLESAREVIASLFPRAPKPEADSALETAAAIDKASASSLADLLARPAATHDALAETLETERLLGKPAKDHRNVDKIIETMLNGRGINVDRLTAWDVLNGVTEFVDHRAARTQDARLQSAWLGKGADLKTAAFDKLMAV